MDKLVVVIPAYFEEEILDSTISTLTDIYEELLKDKKISQDSTMLFVNDGSTDQTWSIIENSRKGNPFVTGINLSRNTGHQNALWAGMTVASQDADMIVTIDADLQDDPRAIIEMVDDYHAGYDVVYGVRNNRDSDTAFKRDTAGLFYKFMNKIGVKTIPNHADFRLLSNRAVKNLLAFPERNLFLRGMVPLVGFPSTKVFYARRVRKAGKSKYPLRKMLLFAWDGITSFSEVPIRAIMVLGLTMVVFSAIYVLYALIRWLTGYTTTGWTSIMISIWLLGGIELIVVGIVGEYIGKIFKEVKRRPRFIIQEDLYTKANPVPRSKKMDKSTHA
ncbi:glycosyltransferase family 2 protein [Oenococcus sicerae]|uniref:Glycosyltransferase n=1 Tax=Oenococcus sicerae TaxID=2203724 RepID=A0AAJ1R9W5_9LACO|nr:glycosyltransferase family 2 protein [Oenococcus sicerae]MDN6899683.1 glycosyltransferase [Oenococcus sicerae]QAS70377.1 glycosyltransferase family 2 protein [Oenococcus sicerae]VDK13596.1 putative glycosyltransferase YkoT [Oenococcus sicerae]